MSKTPDAEAFLARAAAAYGQQPPTLKVEGVPTVFPTCGYVTSDDPGAIHIKMEALGWATTALHRCLAHEYGHVLLGNYRAGTTMAIELDTDVKGVEVLMKADGLTEREAFEAFYYGKGGRSGDARRETLLAGPTWPRHCLRRDRGAFGTLS